MSAQTTPPSPDSESGQPAPPATDRDSRRQRRRVARTSLIGTSIEWYDFNIYGTAAALVLGRQFFPGFSPVAATLAAFATFGVGFLARPVGGVVMGHFGDRWGRKSMLVTSLVLMGAGTFAIGLLPNYASIGIAAPILLVLLRFVQGLGVGGEWGGAVLMAVEHAPPRRRTFYGSFAQMGNPIGIIAATGVFLLLGAALTPDQMASWGWRLPFLLSAVLVVYGLRARMRIVESPEFRSLAEEGTSRAPLVEMIRGHSRTLGLAGAAAIVSPALGYLMFVYLITYGRDTLGLPASLMLWLTIAAAVVWLLLVGVAAILADTYGRRRVYIAGTVLTGFWAIPFFALLDTTALPLMLLAYAGFAVAIAAMTGAQAGLVADLFPPRIRYSGASTAYQIGSIFGGALAPIIATTLVASTGTSLSIGVYVVVLAVVSLLGLLGLREPSVIGSRPGEP